MTRILSLETSGDWASAALYADGSVTLSLLKEKNRHTEGLLTLVDEVLSKAGLKAADVDAVAFGAGPGAFTGLRVACGAAQGLAWAVGKPVIAVGNLAAAAYGVMRADETVTRLVVANDARMHECYTASFTRGADAVPETLTEPELVKPEMLAEYLAKASADAAGAAVTGSALAAYSDEIAVPEGVRVIDTEQVTAEDIVRLAAVMYEKGETTDPHLAAPLYVRNRVALTIEERRAGEKL